MPNESSATEESGAIRSSGATAGLPSSVIAGQPVSTWNFSAKASNLAHVHNALPGSRSGVSLGGSRRRPADSSAYPRSTTPSPLTPFDSETGDCRTDYSSLQKKPRRRSNFTQSEVTSVAIARPPPRPPRTPRTRGRSGAYQYKPPATRLVHNPMIQIGINRNLTIIKLAGVAARKLPTAACNVSPVSTKQRFLRHPHS